MRYTSFFLFLFFLTLSVIGGKAQSTSADSIGAVLTLRQAVDIAIRNNLVVNQTDLQSQSYKVAYDQSWEYMLPTLGFNGNQSVNFGRSLNTTNYTYVTKEVGSGSYNLNAGVTIFQGLALQNNLKAARYNFEASRRDLQYQKDNITLNVLLAYLSILSAQDQLINFQAQLTSDTIQLTRVTNQDKAGALLVLSNLTDLQGSVAQDQINIATGINNLEQSKVNLFQLLNVPYKREVEYENSVTTADLAEYQVTSPDSLYNSALRVVPNIQSTSLRVKEYERTLAAVRGGYFPTLTLGASVNTYYNGAATDPVTNAKIPWGTQFHDNRSEQIGLNLNVPILNGFRVRNNVKNAKLNLQNARLNETNTRLALQQNVEQAFQQMVAAYKQYKFFIDESAAFAESFRITNIRFTEGVINSDIYIQAKARSDVAATALAAAKYAYVFRTKVLDYYQGKLAIQ